MVDGRPEAELAGYQESIPVAQFVDALLAEIEAQHSTLMTGEVGARARLKVVELVMPFAALRGRMDSIDLGEVPLTTTEVRMRLGRVRNRVLVTTAALGKIPPMRMRQMRLKVHFDSLSDCTGNNTQSAKS